MRKRNFAFCLDKVFWYIIYALPILILLISAWGGIALDFGEVLDTIGINQSNVIYVTLVELFGDSGILPLFSSTSPMFLFLTYFVVAMIIHLAVDTLLFIPRFAHSLFDTFESDRLNSKI